MNYGSRHFFFLLIAKPQSRNHFPANCAGICCLNFSKEKLILISFTDVAYILHYINKKKVCQESRRDSQLSKPENLVNKHQEKETRDIPATPPLAMRHQGRDVTPWLSGVIGVHVYRDWSILNNVTHKACV